MVSGTENSPYTPPLTHEEWLKVKAPFSYVELRFNKRIVIEMVDKWCGINVTSSWWYRDEDMLVFESKAVCMAFKMWVEGKPFEDSGEIAIYG